MKYKCGICNGTDEGSKLGKLDTIPAKWGILEIHENDTILKIHVCKHCIQTMRDAEDWRWREGK